MPFLKNCSQLMTAPKQIKIACANEPTNLHYQPLNSQIFHILKYTFPIFLNFLFNYFNSQKFAWQAQNFLKFPEFREEWKHWVHWYLVSWFRQALSLEKSYTVISCCIYIRMLIRADDNSLSSNCKLNWILSWSFLLTSCFKQQPWDTWNPGED